MNELEKIYGKPYINEDLLEKVMKARTTDRLHDDSFKVWEHQDTFSAADKRWFSELGRSIERLSKEEAAIVVYTAIQNWPEMVFQLLLEEYLINKEEVENGKN